MSSDLADFCKDLLLEPVTATPPDDPLARFVALEHERRRLEAALKKVTDEAAALEERILDEWADRGQQNARVAGMTVFIANDFYCNKAPGVDKRVVCNLLNQVGLSSLVGPDYNASSLKAWVKERIRDWAEEHALAGEELPVDPVETARRALPPELSSVLSCGTVARLRTRLV